MRECRSFRGDPGSSQRDAYPVPREVVLLATTAGVNLEILERQAAF